jgi:hypothetical protein
MTVSRMSLPTRHSSDFASRSLISGFHSRCIGLGSASGSLCAAPAPTSFSIENARVHVTARLTARYRGSVLRPFFALRYAPSSAHYRPQRPHSARPVANGRVASLSRVASPPIRARRATPPTGEHGPLPPALDFYAPRLSSLTLHSRAQRAPPPVRTCITCSCSWDRHENGNPHAVYSRGAGGRSTSRRPFPLARPPRTMRS